MTRIEKNFTLLFVLITLSELIFTSVQSLETLHFFTKPLIVIALLIFFIINGKHLDTYTRNLTIMALLFSVTGDILLMFTDQSANFFLIGLIAFLLAHIMYILVFRKRKNSENPSIVFAIILLIYSAGLFLILKDGLGDFLFPVIVYMVVILSMAYTAVRRKGNVPHSSFYLVVVGAILFIVSDSLIALDKFYSPIPYSRLIIMTTYAMAQYGIIRGVLKQEN